MQSGQGHIKQNNKVWVFAMRIENIDFNKSLKILTDFDYGEAPNHSTGLIYKVHELWKLPLKLWTNEDFRLMIMQQISLDYLVPIALYRLAKNPFNSGELYVGDLLNAVTSIDEEFWILNKDLHYELDTIIDSLKIDIETFNEIIDKYKCSY